MIGKLLEIKGCGILQNYRQGDESEFVKYNLVYGWNGSGKTTLGRIFRWIELPGDPTPFAQGKFKIQTTIGLIDETFASEVPHVRVFNRDFVAANTNLEKGKTNSLLYLGKENADLKKEIDALTNTLLGATGNEGLKKDTQNERNKFRNLNKVKEDFFTTVGQELKRATLQTIFTNPNIDKSHAEAVWREIGAGNSLNDFRLEDEDLKNMEAFIAQGTRKAKVAFQIQSLSYKSSEEHVTSIIQILRENPVNKSIQRLKDNNDIATWVQQGFELHKKHESLKCEYCGNAVDPNREIALADHFNQEFIQFQKQIDEKILTLRLFQPKPVVIDTAKLFSNLKQTADDDLNELETKRLQINKEIENWIDALTDKRSNPLKKDFSVSSIGGAENIGPYNDHNESLRKGIDRHNSFVVEFDETAEKYRNRIFKHIVATKAVLENFRQTLSDIERTKGTVQDYEAKFSKISKEIEAKKRQLLDDQIAIDDINKDLHKFLSRDDLTLAKNQNGEGGYVIQRKEGKAENLSEGEKTAIALIYFIAKLSEQGNDIKRNILVFDDPISSFDSNHLFSAASYIMNACENAEQVFIMTHNFWFFKLIRDWIARKNKKDSVVGRFFTIRQGKLSNAGKTLTNYHSEYHFIFDCLLAFEAQKALELNDAYSIANYSRRLLESFNSFKTQDTSGLQGVLQLANELDIKKTETDKLYYYINKYSHLDRIETFENTIENIEAEGKSVLSLVFQIIEKVDPVHFKSMIKICKK